MKPRMRSLVGLLILAAPTAAQEPSFELETFTLPNGMTVVLHPDSTLPKVVIDTWFAVGSKDEAPGRTGFAHLFEHLMFMGTRRVPSNQFDVLMERAGGSNNASTGPDRTNYFSTGPSSILPLLLWLDADRLDGLADAMTQEKLDRQREVVRNERRQTSENVPYGAAELVLPEMLWPPGHPYHHPVIGSHEDLEAATVEDVVDFFHTYYVPSNATLVVAGDFDPEVARDLVEHTFGAIPAQPTPPHRSEKAVPLERDQRRVVTDHVRFGKLVLAWRSPALFEPGDGEMDLAATILAGGPSSRLQQELVVETGLAQEVDASQQSGELGSSFQIEVLAAPGADLEEIARTVLAAVAELGREGPRADELERARARAEAGFLRRIESLYMRAEKINSYRHYWGISDGFQRDLERWTRAEPEGVRRAAAAVFAAPHVDLRILPAGDSQVDRTALDQRPPDLPDRPVHAPVPDETRLTNGCRLLTEQLPGRGLFAGTLVIPGGERLFGQAQAGRATLLARCMESGAGGLDRAAFAAAQEALGAQIDVQAGRDEMQVSVSGLTSRLPETLDLLRDQVLAPNLTPADFEREQALLVAAIRARDDDPRTVASDTARRLVFGDSYRGRPIEGSEQTVAAVSTADLRPTFERLVSPRGAAFVFAGDFDPSALSAALEQRFGSWRAPAGEQSPAEEPARTEPAPRLVLVDRPGAPQTVIQILRPLAAPSGERQRLARRCVDTVLGGTFTSRLNANLREDKGYTYGAYSRLVQERGQHLLLAGSSVVTEHTADAMKEFRSEFERLATDGITAEELAKARVTLRRRIVESAETTARMARTLADLVADERPREALAQDLAALEQVTLDDAQEVARSGLYDWSGLTVVLVGDRAAVLPALTAAGFAPELAEPGD